MSNVKTTTVNAYTKDEAFVTLEGVNVSKIKNATPKWKAMGEPVVGTKEFAIFAEEFMKAKKASEAYVTLKAGSADTRERPYKVVSVKGEGKRKFKRYYQISEAVLASKTSKVTDEETGKVKEVIDSVKVVSRGVVVDKAEKKADAEKIMKELIAENKIDYVIDIVMEVVEGEPIASYGIYTPSASAVIGKFAIITDKE